ncbi:MAG: hypothetical protein EA351_09745 [Gemmatimonadales bacterium]|nr:MAG: hypothetical protein EA351_09745 [Gemmatimonadales bacterium]
MVRAIRARLSTGGVRTPRMAAVCAVVLVLAACASSPGTDDVDTARPPMVHTAPDRPDRPVDPRLESAIESALHPPEEIRVYTGSGSPVEWADLVRAAGDVEVVLLGEIHNDGVGHRARHALVAAGITADTSTAISLEMFETDVQEVLDEYLGGWISEEHFLRASRPWDNYASDYRPYVEMAREAGLPLLGANPPRRYVNRVSRLGTESLAELPPSARRWLPPLPYPGPSDAYRAEWESLMEGAGPHGVSGPEGEAAAERMLEAQGLWDAGMAWTIVEAIRADAVDRIIHVAGAFHVANGTGIPELVQHYRPGTTMLLIIGYPVDPGSDFDPVAHGGRGDFILLAPTR